TTSLASEWYKEWVKERQAVVKSSGMDAVWEMTKHLWFTDAYVDKANADYHQVRNVFIGTKIPGYLGGTSGVAHLAYQPDLHRIDVPTLVIAAGDDPVTPVDHAEAIHERISTSRLDVLPGQRHFSNVEVPEAFNAVLVPFLDEVCQ
ncbi:MAG: alpha/beta hydrolase, partial [Pseudomonadota bacterium]